MIKRPAGTEMRVKIHHEGTNILLVSAAAIAVVITPMWLWVRPIAWPIAVTAVLGVLYLLTVNFFRSPRRHFEGDTRNAVVARTNTSIAAAYSCRCS